MSEHEKYYKNLTKTSDFIVLVCNKITLLINDKLANYASELNECINTNNLDLLKKKHNVWHEIIKNYTTFTTTLNNLISFDHTLNYSRKIIFKELLKKIDSEYIKKKLDKINIIGGQFIEHSKTCISTLNYFSKLLDINEAKNAVIKATETFETKHLPRVISSNQDIIDILTKKGSFEQCTQIMNKLQEFNINRGFEKSNLYEVILGGFDDGNKIAIGGYKIKDFVSDQFINYKLMKKELDDFNSAKKIDEKIDEKKEYYNNFKYILDEYTNLINLNSNELIQYMMTKSSVYKNIYEQYTRFVTNELPKLIQYHVTRFMQTNDSGDPNEINIELSWDYNNITKSIDNLITGFKKIFNLIDIADKNKIIKDAKINYKKLVVINNINDFNIEYENLESDYDIIRKEFSYESRKNAKRVINEIIDLIYIDISKINRVEKKDINIIKNKIKIEDNLDNALKIMKYVIDTELQLVNIASQYEVLYDSLTNNLYNLILEINSLISPDNKFTCIKRPSLVINTGLKAVILYNILDKRFPGEEIYKIPEIINYISKLLDYDINNFYSSKNGLMLENINSIDITGFIKI